MCGRIRFTDYFMQNKRKYNSIQKYLLQENRKFHQSSMQHERVDIENNVKGI